MTDATIRTVEEFEEHLATTKRAIEAKLLDARLDGAISDYAAFARKIGRNRWFEIAEGKHLVLHCAHDLEDTVRDWLVSMYADILEKRPDGKWHKRQSLHLDVDLETGDIERVSDALIVDACGDQQFPDATDEQRNELFKALRTAVPIRFTCEVAEAAE